jgi:hypothetical protein
MVNEYQTQDDFTSEISKFDILMAKLDTVVEKISNKQQFDVDNRGYEAALKFTNEQLSTIINDLDKLNKSNVIS